LNNNNSIVGSIGRSYSSGFESLILINAAVVAIVSLSIAIFFFIIGGRILKVVKEGARTSKSKGISRVY
jgi:hypothetical protein